jgi:hypothetical protein
VEVIKRRAHERRRYDASFFLMERRSGSLWKYGSIVVCVTLVGILARMWS